MKGDCSTCSSSHLVDCREGCLQTLEPCCSAPPSASLDIRMCLAYCWTCPEARESWEEWAYSHWSILSRCDQHSRFHETRAAGRICGELLEIPRLSCWREEQVGDIQFREQNELQKMSKSHLFEIQGFDPTHR